MAREPVAAGDLAGWVAGDGHPVLLLHGGPGLPFDYLDGLAAELGDGYRVAAFQQRGLAPSSTTGAFTIAEAVTDVVAVLDALGWDRAHVVGHSWGGHLLAHLLVARPDRLLGALILDGLGTTGDGGESAFEAELLARTPEADRRRAHELDQRAMAGEGSEQDVQESLGLLWPAYFAARDHVMAMPEMRASIPAYSGLWDDIRARLPQLEGALANVAAPVAVVHGTGSPMPVAASRATADAIPGATLTVVEGAGHFPWFERPGSVRDALAALVAG